MHRVTGHKDFFLFSIIQFKCNRKCVFMAHWMAFFFCKLLATELINQGLFWQSCMLICFTIISLHFPMEIWHPKLVQKWKPGQKSLTRLWRCALKPSVRWKKKPHQPTELRANQAQLFCHYRTPAKLKCPFWLLAFTVVTHVMNTLCLQT